MDTIIINDKKCVKCGDCVFICPVGVFATEGKKVIVTDNENCCGKTCRMCVEYCWQDAIEFG